MGKLGKGFLYGLLAALVVGSVVGFVGGGTFNAGLLGVVAMSVTTAIMTGLQGNVKVREGSSGDREEAITQPARPGLAVIYVRREGFVARFVGINVALDDVVQTQLKSGRFVRLDVPPGNHTLTGYSTGFKAPLQGPASITLAEGEKVSYSLSLQHGVASGNVQLVRDAEVPVTKLRGLSLVMAMMAVTFTVM